ncbi:MAG: glutathione S-transferase N-terminal domain-containing protein [Candidatus Omnitrophica bacterium]|nr:glutathione S-transferase N-terminal domain-containing protein [Candidatus Omnitrophota bacterium]
MTDLTLYYMPTCPFCQKVITFMKKNDIEIPMKDINEGENRQGLLMLGGKTQVPCLVIDGKAMYESDDIITWFKDNAKKLKQAF